MLICQPMPNRTPHPVGSNQIGSVFRTFQDANGFALTNVTLTRFFGDTRIRVYTGNTLCSFTARNYVMAVTYTLKGSTYLCIIQHTAAASGAAHSLLLDQESLMCARLQKHEKIDFFVITDRKFLSNTTAPSTNIPNCAKPLEELSAKL